MIKNKIGLFLKKYFLNINEEVPVFLLHKLYHQGGYLPFTRASLKFRLLACLTNDIVINNKKSILEFGAGISTIIVARLIKLNNLDAKIVTIDESQEWIEVVKNLLKNEGLDEVVQFIYAPTSQSSDLNNSFEYDDAIVKKELGNTKFDVVLIDGPIAWSSKKRYSRVSNIKYFINNLKDDYTIFVDDTERKGEKAVVKKLQQELKIKPKQIDPTFITFAKGNIFNFEI